MASGTAQNTLWWLLGTAATLAMGGGSLWLNHVDGQIRELRDGYQLVMPKISALETSKDDISRRLDRIEAKLDVALERGR